MTRPLSRRKFLAGAAGGAAIAAVGPLSAPAIASAGSNAKVRLGFIGTGGRGQHHIGNFQHEDLRDRVEIVAVCDVDPGHLGAAASRVGGGVRKTPELRDVLDAKDIDAVVISTPDHWHAWAAVKACEAGKDVYVEKPIGQNIREGRLVAEAAKKHGRIVAIGTQQRSGDHWADAVRRIREGEIGKVTLVHAWNAWGLDGMGGDLGTPPDSDPPPGVDYDRWLGPSPKRRFNPVRFHFGFYFFWDYSGGMVSAWGVHLFDIVSWAMGTGIQSVATTGGKLVHQDIRETPDTATTVFECPGYTLTYTMRHGSGFPLYGTLDHGIDFHGSKGTLRINRQHFSIFPEGSGDPSVYRPLGFSDPEREKKQKHGEEYMDLPHKRNWLDCLASRKKPNADAEDGHLASVYGHLANIAYRVGRRIRWDPSAETIPGDSEAAKLLTREYRAPWAL